MSGQFIPERGGQWHRIAQVKQNRPDLIGEPCEGIWEGGPTPCECVKAMVEGYTEFIANNYPEK